MNRQFRIALVAAAVVILTAVSDAGAWWHRGGYGYHYGGFGGYGEYRYNSFNGGYYRRAGGYDSYTGRYAGGRSFYNPYTGRYGNVEGAYNPYTNRYAYHYSYGNTW
jgi:hypothetical protein